MSQRLIARRYAKALLDLAVKEGDAAKVQQELQDLGAMVSASPDLDRLVTAPLIAPSKKTAAFIAILRQGGASDLLCRFFQVVTQAARLALFHEIVAAYGELLDERLGIVEAHVTSAHPLSSPQAARLEEALARRTGRTVRLKARQDPALLGGLKVQVGSTVFDASLDGQLRQLGDRLLSA